MSLPKGMEKPPTGVEVRGSQVRIAFTYRGERCREPIEGYSKITKAVLAYADNKRRTILAEIKEGKFDYAAHFPSSERAHRYSGYGGSVADRTVVQGVKKWLAVQEAKKAPSTYRNYKHKAAHVKRKWPGDRIRDLNKSDIELFQSELLKSDLAPKTVNDIFTVVRGVWSDAFHDGVIKADPLQRIKNIERDDNEETADPFSREELNRIAGTKTHRQQDINMIMFASWTGLSLSEVIAIAWEDVDTVNWTVKVQRAKVQNEYKVPKEKSRVRIIELIDPAIEWLKKQMPHTTMLPAKPVTIRQRDNITMKEDSLRLIFLNGQSQQPWHDSSVRRWFTSHLRKAKIRHRGPNQCRHTFASQLLSNYVPLEWVARQLGHSDTKMIKKHYGRWIPSDTRSMAGMISEMLGFRKPSEPGIKLG